MGFSRFPRKKKINWIEVQTPPCLHTFRKVYVSIGSCQWCPPTKHTFSGSIPLPIIHFQHLALIHASFWGVTPPSSHTFLAKSEGVNPPLCSYIIRNVGSTPPTPEPVGVGDYSMQWLSALPISVCLAPNLYIPKVYFHVSDFVIRSRTLQDVIRRETWKEVRKGMNLFHPFPSLVHPDFHSLVHPLFSLACTPMKITIIIVIIIIITIIIITKLKKVHLSHPLRDSFCMGIRCVVRACPSRRCLDLLSRQMCRLED